jgi:ubiquinone/menaquinone biosynthesis C-methylase UbiE
MFYCTANATFLPFDKGTFDAIFGFGFLHHVLEWQTGLQEIIRVLRPGGIYYMLEFYPALYQNFLTRRLLVHPEKNRFNSADLKTALRDNGLDLAHTLEIKKLGILAIGIKK